MFVKNKYDELHIEQAKNITRNEFCKSCREHEGLCREYCSENPKCWTFIVVMRKIKKVFDKHDR